MALIKCCECNAEVSEYAENCPRCGCPVSISLEKIASVLMSIGITTHFTDVRFDHGISDGSKGTQINDYHWASGPCTHYSDYYVIGNNLHTQNRKGGFPFDYKIIGECLVRTEPFMTWKGQIPDGETFHCVCKCYERDDQGPFTLEFFEDGTYNEQAFRTEYRPGVYLRKDNLIVGYPTEAGKGLPWLMVIDGNSLFRDACVLGKTAQNAKLLLEKAKQKVPQAALPSLSTNRSVSESSRPSNQSSSSSHSIICPYCGSSQISRISSISRLTSVYFWGIGSSKVGKQWHCTNCNSNF